eukprot:scaffold26813_cov223-Skeletonema_menzelii.AAC.1
MSVADFVEEYIEDPHGIFDDEDKLAEIIADIESKPPKSEKSNVYANKIATYKRALEDMEDKDDEGKSSASKKARTDLEEKARAYAVYNSKKNAELQDILRWNLGYGTSGTKEVLLTRWRRIASLLLSAIFHLSPQQTDALLKVALEKGAGGNDPWRALLDEISTCDDTSTSKQQSKKRKISSDKDINNTNTTCTSRDLRTSSSQPRQVLLRVAFEAAKTALLLRRAKLIEGESLCQYLSVDLEAECEKNEDNAAKVQANRTINILRRVEKSILDQAIDILS